MLSVCSLLMPHACSLLMLLFAACQLLACSLLQSDLQLAAAAVCWQSAAARTCSLLLPANSLCCPHPASAACSQHAGAVDRSLHMLPAVACCRLACGLSLLLLIAAWRCSCTQPAAACSQPVLSTACACCLQLVDAACLQPADAAVRSLLPPCLQPY